MVPERRGKARCNTWKISRFSKRKGIQTDPSLPELRRQSGEQGRVPEKRKMRRSAVCPPQVLIDLTMDQYMCVRKLQRWRKNYRKGAGATVPRVT